MNCINLSTCTFSLSSLECDFVMKYYYFVANNED